MNFNQIYKKDIFIITEDEKFSPNIIFDLLKFHSFTCEPDSKLEPTDNKDGLLYKIENDKVRFWVIKIAKTPITNFLKDIRENYIDDKNNLLSTLDIADAWESFMVKHTNSKIEEKKLVINNFENKTILLPQPDEIYWLFDVDVVKSSYLFYIINKFKSIPKEDKPNIGTWSLSSLSFESLFDKQKSFKAICTIKNDDIWKDEFHPLNMFSIKCLSTGDRYKKIANTKRGALKPEGYIEYIISSIRKFEEADVFNHNFELCDNLHKAYLNRKIIDDYEMEISFPILNTFHIIFAKIFDLSSKNELMEKIRNWSFENNSGKN